MKWAAWAVRAAANAALLAGEGKDVALARTGRGGGGGVSSAQASERAIAVTGDGRKEDGMPRGRRTVPEDAMG